MSQSAVPDKTTDIIRTMVMILIVVSFIIFLHWLALILHIYMTTPHLRETSRYVLFVHMLVTDMFYLLISFFLFLSSVYLLYMPVTLCYAFGTFTTSSFRVTPYNLAFMSIERYVAICFPLRHADTCTVHWCKSMIAIMWALGLLPIAIDFIAMNFSVSRNFYSTYLVCNWLSLSKNEVQSTIRSLVLIVSFAMVGLVILYTYVKVMLVARKLGSGKSSAFRAGRTVLLHAFQLLLCMSSFLSVFTETYLKNSYAFVPSINFFFLMCLPRFISPLIYGIRDQAVRKCIQNAFKQICFNRQFQFYK
ncbi:odorant receptor 131-2-like [Gastrophryne carolinensis]